MIKPAGLERGLVGHLICRFERRGLRLVGAKFCQPTRALMEKQYGPSDGKEPWFADLIAYVTSGPLLGLVWEGENAQAAVDQIMGEADPLLSAPGTIRADFDLDRTRTVMHRAKTPGESKYDIGLWFSGDHSLFEAEDILPAEGAITQMADNIIPQHPAIPHTERGEQPIQPSGFDYIVLPQPEHLKEPFNSQTGGQPVMPSKQIHAIRPWDEQPY